MRINKDELERLARLPDDQLWAEIVRVGRAHGFSLPESTPPHSELEKLRSAVTGAKLNLGEAMRVLSNYKKG